MKRKLKIVIILFPLNFIFSIHRLNDISYEIKFLICILFVQNSV